LTQGKNSATEKNLCSRLRNIRLAQYLVVFDVAAFPLFIMPLPTSPDFSDWHTFWHTLLQHLASTELVLRKLLPDLTVLTGFALLCYLLTLAALDVLAWWSWRRSTRLGRLRARFQRIRAKIIDQGQNKRLRLVRVRQRRNLRELAGLVEKQLRTTRGHLHPNVFKRTSVFIHKSVRNLDFDRLYSLHRLLSQADKQQLAPRLETFFQQAR
jgi:hypothetical protein